MNHSSARKSSKHLQPQATHARRRTLVTFIGAIAAVILASPLVFLGPVLAATPVDLGTAAEYSVLGGTTVTNTGPSVLQGSLGVSPGTAITGFPPGIVGGASHAGDAQALQAQSDVIIAYNATASQALTESVAGDLVGRTLPEGVYNSTGPLALSGTLTLDGQGDPSSVFIFQIASTLITASASNIILTNSAQACNVYWQVGSSATLGTDSTFKGTIMALTSISVTTGAVLEGRALARNGQVSLDNNVFTTPGCDLVMPTVTPTATDTPTPTTTAIATDTPTATVAPTTTPTATSTQTVTVTATTTPTSTITSVTPEATVTDSSTTNGAGNGAGRNNGVNVDTAAAVSHLNASGPIAGTIIAGLVGLAGVFWLRLQGRRKH
ncbi:ice-binding family protein (plasmid) [Arthrobacter sp. TMP15]|uniref:ice-binding family protein n=1 Tax=Arthrobacter sp. TMP15 TaxID=3140789 RepID=UPI0031BB6E8A